MPYVKHELCQLSNSLVSLNIPPDNFRIIPHPIHDIILRSVYWKYLQAFESLPIDTNDGLFLGKS